MGYLHTMADIREYHEDLDTAVVHMQLIKSVSRQSQDSVKYHKGLV